MVFRVISVLALTVFSAAAQASMPTPEADLDYITVVHDHIPWPSPESLVKGLLSKDDGTRLKALRLVGVDEQHARVPIWTRTSPARIIREAVVTPDRVELKYAALGGDATQQAILVVETADGQFAFAAVAVPTPQGWTRIATSDCWCKYETGDVLAEFVQLRRAPQPTPATSSHFELVLMRVTYHSDD